MGMELRLIFMVNLGKHLMHGSFGCFESHLCFLSIFCCAPYFFAGDWDHGSSERNWTTLSEYLINTSAYQHICKLLRSLKGKSKNVNQESQPGSHSQLSHNHDARISSVFLHPSKLRFTLSWNMFFETKQRYHKSLPILMPVIFKHWLYQGRSFVSSSRCFIISPAV